MDIAKRVSHFNKRWEIIKDEDHQQNFEQFKIRILNDFEDIDELVTEEGIADFCRAFGIRKYRYHPDFHFRADKIIFAKLLSITDERELYFAIDQILNLKFTIRYGIQDQCRQLIKSLKESIQLSGLHVQLLHDDEEGYFLSPSGEKEFDQKLVNEVLPFLNPESRKHFVEALRLSMEKTPKSSIKSAESVRRFLEEFLRYKLSNDKGLSSNIVEAGKKLKLNKSADSFINSIMQFFKYMDDYFNKNSKHNDGDIGEAENEYLIYQAGVLARYIHQKLPSNCITSS